MITKTRLLIAFFLWLLILPSSMPFGVSLSPAYANTAAADINVNASVTSNCNFNSGGGGSTLAFGTYNPAGTNETTALNTTMNFDVRCTKGTAVSLRLDTGEHPNGSVRRMYANGEYLSYELYRNASYTEIWGESTSNDLDYTATSSAFTTPTIYAKIAAGQDVSIGTYTDTVTLTASF